MRIKPYRKDYPEVTKLLYEKGVLTGYPTQVERELLYSEGIDITYTLRGMTPSKFKEYSDALLWAAYEEAKRYDEEPIKFARFDVQLNRTQKGRKTLTQPVREFTTRGRPEVDVMVFGEQALGYDTGEKGSKPYLINKAEEIIGMAESYMKDYLQRQRPYKVLTLVISIRRRFK